MTKNLPPESSPPVSPTYPLDRAIATNTDRFARWFVYHWLAIFNSVIALFLAATFATPLLDIAGWHGPADAFYYAFSYTCHQLPTRSFFIGGRATVYPAEEILTITGANSAMDLYHQPLRDPVFGYEIPICQRDLAIYVSMLMAGLAFALVRDRLPPLDWRAYLVLIAPMAIDGSGQLLGLWESSWLSRVITGTLFGAASIWLVYPRIEAYAAQARLVLKRLGDKPAGEG